MNEPVTIERPDPGFKEVWHCEQPERYRVIEQSWEKNGTVRHIWKVKAE